MTKSTRVVVVDDFEPFRRFICSTLQRKLETLVICEVSDGVEAVQKAQELQPDIILLDIGLPGLNGMEAARQIRKLSPKSKMIFVTQESSADVVQEAFNIGAEGYVVKTDARSELLPAVEAVLRGERFIPNRFAGCNFTGAVGGQAFQNTSRSVPATGQHKIETAHSHEAEFYPDNARLLDGIGEFIKESLITEGVVVVVATESHHDALLGRLRGKGLDIDDAVKQGRYIALDVTDILSTFTLNGVPDPVRFRNAANDLIDRAATAATRERRVAACGECASVLCERGNFDAALQLEQLWDEVARERDVDILCGYLLGSFQDPATRDIFQQICEEHSAVYSG